MSSWFLNLTIPFNLRSWRLRLRFRETWHLKYLKIHEFFHRNKKKLAVFRVEIFDP